VPEPPLDPTPVAGAAILVLLLAAPPMARSAQAGALETANVMAPLDMRFNDQARNDFRRQIADGQG